MLNSVCNRYVDATIVTDQTETASSFKVWKDYDGVKYAEIPKKPTSSGADLGRSQKITWIPTYPALEQSMPSSVLQFNFDSQEGSYYVHMKMLVPLESSIWRSSIPVGPKTVLIESSKGILQNFYFCGAHPNSDISFNRQMSLYDTTKEIGMGSLEFRMPFSVVESQVSGGIWTSAVNTPASYGGATATFRADLVALVEKINTQYSSELSSAIDFSVDISDEALWTDDEIANLARLFIVPILSCTGINAAAAKQAYNGELPMINLASDINQDGSVSLADLLLLLQAFNPADPFNPIIPEGDITGDSAVNPEALGFFLSAFGAVL